MEADAPARERTVTVDVTPAPAPAPEGAVAGHPLLALQRAAGNAAVVGMLNGPAVASDPTPPTPSAPRGAGPAVARKELPTIRREPQARVIRRFVTAKEFAERTDEGTFTRKGPAQQEIEKLLKTYLALGVATKRPPTAKPHPSGVTVQLTIAEDKLDQGIALLRQMKQIAEMWVASKTKETTDAAGKTVTTIDSSRAKRGAGMVWFLMACDGEISRLEAYKAKADKEGTLKQQADVQVDTTGMAKLKEKYTGSLGSALSTASTLVGKAIANDGDSTEFELDVKIPVSPGVFVGALLHFIGEKRGVNTEVSVDAMFQAGASLGIGDIHGALGGYFKASGKTPEGAMKLISYGFYRRCRESDVIPSEISNKIWGGESGAKGRKKADEWSKEVEETELTNDDSYVETGAVAEVGGGVDAGPIATAKAAAKGSTGKRHDKLSLDKTKGGAGEDNDIPILGGEKSTGRSVHAIDLVAKANVLGGHLAGDVKFHLDWRDSLDGKGAEFSGMWFQFRASGRMETTGLEGAIGKLVGDFAKTAAAMSRKQFQQASGTDQLKKLAVPGLTLAKDSADVALEDLQGINTVEWYEKNSPFDKLLDKPKPSPDAAKGPSLTQSHVGIELAVRYTKVGDNATTLFEIRHISALDAKLPGVLKAELARRSRLAGWQKSGAGGGWTFLG